MKISLKLVTVIIGILIFAASCKAAETETGQLKVYTSFYPMYDFAKKVGGDKIQVISLMSSGEEIHDWEPTPSDIVNLETADMFIYSGAGMEHWVEKTLSALKSDKLVVVEASEDTKLIGGYKGDHEEGEHDPHVWLSIRNAKKEMENIKNAFVKIDSENKEYYEGNYNKYAKEFDDLDALFKDKLSALPNKNIVVSHKAFGYLCNDYGLTQIGIQGLVPDSEPDPARMAEVIGFVKEKNVKVIFFEGTVSPKVSEVIAKETGAETAMLSTLEGLTDEQRSKGEEYISVMKENLEALEKAMQ